MKTMKTKDILVAGMIAVVFAIVQVGLTYMFMTTSALAGPVYARIFDGFWYMSGFMAMFIIRKPGIALVAQAIAGIIMIPMTPFGLMMLFGTLICGVLTELVFLITRYKRFTLPVYMIGMSSLSLIYALLEYGPSGYGGLAIPVQIGILSASAFSGAVCGWLCKRISGSLLQTGLLSGYTESRNKVANKL